MTLDVADAGIDETKLATSVAGDGLIGGGGSPLAVQAGNGVDVVGDEVALGALTADWQQIGGFDLVLDHPSSELRLRESGDSDLATLDVGALAGPQTFTLAGTGGTLLTATAGDGAYVNVAGDTMTGDLAMSGNDLTGTASVQGTTRLDLTANTDVTVNFDEDNINPANGDAFVVRSSSVTSFRVSELNITAGRPLGLGGSSTSVADGDALTPSSSFVLLASTPANTAVTLGQIVNGSTSAQLLILTGTSDSGTVTVPDSAAANTQLAGPMTLGAGDTLILVYFTDRREISRSDN